VNWANERDPVGSPHQARLYYLRTALDLDNPVVQSKLGWADVLVFQRNIVTPDVWAAMDYWRALGKVVLVDLDDHYPHIPASNPAHPYWAQNVLGLDPEPVAALEEGLRHADALLAPNRLILRDWAHVVDGYYWPNYLPGPDYWDLDKFRRPPSALDVEYLSRPAPEGSTEPLLLAKEREGSAGQVVIGWGGSISHVDSFRYSGVLPALSRLLRDRPNVVFKFCGHEARLDPYFAALPAAQVIRQPGVFPAHWPKVVATFDVGIAPLDLRPCPGGTASAVEGYAYDERRSWLKLVEYVGAGVPFVASRGEPYRDLARFGAVVDNTEEAWYDALRSRVDSIGAFREEAAKYRRWAMKRLTAEANVPELMRMLDIVGKTSQARAGRNLPNTTYVEAGEPVADQPTLSYRSGDPLETGVAATTNQARELAATLAIDHTLYYKGLLLGAILEYPLTERFNIALVQEPPGV